jgi:hypothetical protein
MSEPFIKGSPEASEKPEVVEAPHEAVGGVEPSPFRWLGLLLGAVVVMSGVVGGWWVINNGWPGMSSINPTCGDGNWDEHTEECEIDPVRGCPVGMLCENCLECVLPETCGNGVVDGPTDTETAEQCDGDASPCAECESCVNCQCLWWPPETCGNSILDDCEYCDGDALGTCIGGLVCSDWCTCMWPDCANGVLEEGEECDPWIDDGSADCPPGQACVYCQCEYQNVCGNGIVEPGEDCDGTDLSMCLSGQVCENCQCATIVGGDVRASSVCGDGHCDTATENSDLCPQDCPCVDDGHCAPGEGFNCADCGDPTGACGVRCDSSDTCPDPLECFNAVCWDSCVCGGNCGGRGEGGETCARPCDSHRDCSCWEGCVDGCCSCP